MRRLALLTAATLVASLLVAAPAGAQTSDTFGTVTVVHGVPGVAVDVYVDGIIAIPGLDFEQVSDPLVLTTGSHDIEVFEEGADPGPADPIIVGTADVTEGLNATVALHLTAGATPQPTLTVYTNDTTTLGEDEARVVARHTAAVPPVDIALDGIVVFDGLANANEEQADVPSGTYTIEVREGGGTAVLFSDEFELEPGTSYLVHVVGTAPDAVTVVVQTITGLQPDFALQALLDGTQEVPAVETGAAGVGGFQVSEDETSVDFTLVAWYLEDITMGHVHIGAVGANGPIAAVLADFAPLDATSGETRNGLLAEGTIGADDLTALPDAGFDGSIGAFVRTLRSAGAYANVHTVANPSGEIRGQVLPLDIVADRFNDDDGSVHEANIDTIAGAGITLGCDDSAPELFCPSEAVSRGQMASFIQRALNLPADGDAGFTDIAGSVHEDAINAIAAAGITIGCEDGTVFCPNDPLTRDQMASFLARAFGLSGGSSPFTDINGNTHEANIVAIYTAGITKGCTATEYCPRDPVLRGQMASFLARSLAWGD